MTNSSGSVADSYTYTAYGSLVASSGSDTNPFRYGGEFGYYTDSTFGTILCGVRWYDPDIGRWLSRDPIGYAGGDNLYAYYVGDPVGLADPSGFDPLNPIQKGQVNQAIGLIRRAGLRRSADVLEWLMKRGHIVVDQNPDGSDVAYTPIWPWTTRNNVTINLRAKIFDIQCPKHQREMFLNEAYIGSILIHELQHAIRQSFIWVKLHPYEKEDRAYAVQFHFLQLLRRKYPKYQNIINEIIGWFF